MFNIGQAIQINKGREQFNTLSAFNEFVYQTVFNCGQNWVGSGDEACSLAVKGRGVGIINSINGNMYFLRWQGSQRLFGYDVTLIEANFKPIPGIWNDSIPFE